MSCSELVARAVLLGDRIDSRRLPDLPRLGIAPPTMLAMPGGGITVVFRYGAVVLFDVSESDEAAMLERLMPAVARPFETPETESIGITVDGESPEGMVDGKIRIHDRSPDRMQLVASVLSKSVVLANHEAKVTTTFDAVEPLAADLAQSGSARRLVGYLLRQIGHVLLSEHARVGRAEIGDKPEILWTRPDLELLYGRLEDEFEIRDRQAILDRKWALIDRTIRTSLELVQYRRMLRVEWYIVLLIVAEFGLSLYEKFFSGRLH